MLARAHPRRCCRTARTGRLLRSAHRQPLVRRPHRLRARVKDLAADGFPLIGGRLDYVDGRRVGAIVYKRRLHTINVFMWPARSNIEGAVKVSVRNGYNVMYWSGAASPTGPVSDLNAEEMRRLEGLL